MTDKSANTDVGKTLLTTALVRASAARFVQASDTAPGPSKRVFYLKPVSTGPDDESDVR
jgi:dethiobiotin synthetase/adenosylmethionine--8-amino-7-oxononanoate aminotransferase